MAICPNCGARVGLNNKCPHCGSLLKTQNSNSNSFIEQLKDVTSDFSQKPTCSKEVFEGLVVNALLTASETEKNIYQARIIAYTNNYLNGGTGIINNPQKSDYINRGENAEGRYVTNGTYSDAVAYKPHRQRMPRAKLAFLLACIVGGLAIIVGTSVGVPLGVRASKEKQKNERTSQVSLYSNYPEDSYMYSGEYVYGHTSREYGETKYLEQYQCPSDLNGYRFLGYYKTKDTAYENDLIFTSTGEQTRAWEYYGGIVNLYGQWERTIITLYLSSNSGEGGQTYISARVDENMPRIYNLPSKTGYSFTGYYSGAYGGTKYYDKDGYSSHVCDLQHEDFLYAHWAANRVVINFDTNGGSGGTSDISAMYDGELPSINVPSKTGYDFAGYFDSETGGDQYYDADGNDTHICDLSDNAYLYAHWSPKNITVELDQNGGSGGDSIAIATYGEDMPSISIPTKDGYTFTGYYTTKTGGTKYYDSYGDSYRTCNFTSSLTLYAHWSVNDYTITFNKNGGSGGTNSTSATYDQTMPTIYSLPSRTGYTFLGYFTSSTGGTKYYDNYGYGVRNCDFTSNTTLYAQWKANQYTVSFNQNGGSGGLSYITATYDSEMPSLYSLPSRTGYTFDGYYTGSTNGIKYYNADGTSAHLWNDTYSGTLYAHWAAIQSTLTLDKNGGTGGSNSVTVSYDSQMPDVEVPTRTGYSFNGYFTSKTGGTQYYSASGYSMHNCDIIANTTLYAQWLPQYTITFDPCGGSGGTSSIVATKDRALPSISIPSKLGYHFTGYFTASTGGTRYYYSDGTSARNYDFNDDVTLYAQWEILVVEIYLYKNNGSGGTTYVNATYGSNLPAISTPTRTGYTFDGYYTSSSGGTMYYNSSGTGVRLSDFTFDTTLYAHWTPIQITVTFNKNSGSGGTSSTYATYGSAMPSISIPTRSGYTFNGYYTSTSGGTKYYNSNGTSARTCDFTSNVTLYAQWTYNTPYTVANTGSYGFTLSGGVYQSNNYHINSSTAQMTVTFQVSGTVSYQYKVSSESSYDKLYVIVNGSYVANGISGSYSWITRSATVSNGSTIVVRYTKDSSVHSNSDRAYFQILSFTAS